MSENKLFKNRVIIPVNGQVLVDIDVQAIDAENAFSTKVDTRVVGGADGVEIYRGTIREVPDVANTEGIEVGQSVQFNAFSGTHIQTDSVTKIIPIADVLVTMKDVKSILPEDIEPTFDRILVEVIEDEKTEGDFQVGEEVDDPRTSAVTYCRVLKVGKDTTGMIKVGDIAGIDTFVGEVVRQKSAGLTELRAFSELYVTFVVRDAP